MGKSIIELKFFFILPAKPFSQLRCHQAWQTEFHSRNPHGEIKKSPPYSYPLTSDLPTLSVARAHPEREKEMQILENIFYIKMYDDFNTAMSSV